MKKKFSIKGVFNFLILITITILVLYFSLKDNLQETLNTIFNLNIGWFLFAIFLFIGSVCVRSSALYKLIKEFKQDYRFSEAIRLSFMTLFFNGVTPFATGGQPFQVYHLKKSGVTITDSTNIIVQNFIVYQIALIFLGLVAVISNYFFHFFKEVGFLKDLVTFGFLANTLVAVGLLVLAFAKNTNKRIMHFGISILSKFHFVKDKEKTIAKWEDTLDRFYKGARLLIDNKRLTLETIGLNILGLCALYIIPLVVAFSMGQYDAMSGFVAIIASAYVMLIGAFVPIPGGTGGLEYSFLQFYGNFFTGSTLNAIMLIWRFVTYYFGMILGACALYIKGKKR